MLPNIEYDDLLDYCLDQPVFVRVVEQVPWHIDSATGEERDTVEHLCQMERTDQPLFVRLSIPGSWSVSPVSVLDIDITEVWWSVPAGATLGIMVPA